MVGGGSWMSIADVASGGRKGRMVGHRRGERRGERRGVNEK
jgi:hypothetical protein